MHLYFVLFVYFSFSIYFSLIYICVYMKYTMYNKLFYETSREIPIISTVLCNYVIKNWFYGLYWILSNVFSAIVNVFRMLFIFYFWVMLNKCRITNVHHYSTYSQIFSGAIKGVLRGRVKKGWQNWNSPSSAQTINLGLYISTHDV